MLKETGERQVKNCLINIDVDHRMRYEFASSLIQPGAAIADIGCGVGYGSYYMAMATACKTVVSVDVSAEAIGYAKEYFGHPKISFQVKDICKEDSLQKFDVITSFEVVEHVPNAEEFLRKIAGGLKEDGIAIFTTPNEEVIPYDPQMFRFHVRHYTVREIEDLVTRAGLEIMHHYSQNGTVVYGFPGNAFHVIVCRLPGAHPNLPEGMVREDTVLNRHMAVCERLNWLLEHIPQDNISNLMLQWKELFLESDALRKDMVSQKDAYVRQYLQHFNSDNPNYETVMHEWKEGDTVTQAFTSGKNGLCGISVRPATYCEKFQGILTMSLLDEAGKKLAVSVFNELEDNTEVQMRFHPLQDSKGKRFQLLVHLTSLEQSSRLTFYVAPSREQACLRYNHIPTEETLTFKCYYM